MRLFKTFVLFLGLATILTAAVPGHAKDLTGRPGIGYINQFGATQTSSTVPSVSMKYATSKDFAWLGTFGVNTATPTAMVIGAKIFKNIFYEPSLNFYSTLGVAYAKNGKLKDPLPGGCTGSDCYESKGGIEFLTALGAEFFIPGVDSLGFSFEAGVSGSTLAGSFALKTIGYTFLNSGIHFYF